MRCIQYFMPEFLVLVLSANNTNLGTVPVPFFVLLIFTNPADDCHPLVLVRAVEYGQCVHRAFDMFYTVQSCYRKFVAERCSSHGNTSGTV